MTPAVQKTLSILLLIGIGILMKKKIKQKEQLGGIKTLILSIALPATIFIALLKIKIEPELFMLPIMALMFNLIMFGAAYLVLPKLGIDKMGADHKTLMMLFGSLAPGLSCFPFIVQYLGEETLAWAALADVGNKVYGLILLYMIAMHWYLSIHQKDQKVSSKEKIKSLLISLIKEPINMVLVVGIAFLAIGWNLASLPPFIQQSVQWMSNLMTPMILLFIGLAVKVRKGDFNKIICMLFLRSGFAFLLSAAAISIIPGGVSPLAALVIVCFPQSSTSFWPFAHMAAVQEMEGKNPEKPRTFNLELALTVLAFSLPFSTITIMSVCSAGNFFVSPLSGLITGIVLIMLGSLPPALKFFQKKKEGEKEAVNLPAEVAPQAK
ncbi:MAG: permease [Bacteroidota bacterium]